ncbi:2-hydroxy-3-keto-5-methylthiopentenyl-1-phosphatephosphatase [Lysinibacillus sphaericus]
MFELLSTNQKDDIIQYLLETAVIREGFREFVHYAQEHNIPFYIVSGGVDFFIQPMLEKFALDFMGFIAIVLTFLESRLLLFI